MSKQPKFKEGDRIILKANKRENWKEERAQILGGPDNGAWMVQVDECYRAENDGDGLREVYTSQMKRLDEVASNTGRVMAAIIEGFLNEADSEEPVDCTVGKAIEEAFTEAGLLEDDGKDQWFVADFSDCDVERLADVPAVRAALIKLVNRLVGAAQQVIDA